MGHLRKKSIRIIRTNNIFVAVMGQPKHETEDRGKTDTKAGEVQAPMDNN